LASDWTHADRRIGMWSAFAVFGIDVVYVVTGAVGLLFARPGPEHFGLVDPALAILEALIVLVVPFMVLTMAAVHGGAPPGTKTCTRAALGFMVLLGGITASIHFVLLTVVRRMEPSSAARLSPLLSFRWPSVALALDLFAWDACLGLSMLLAAPAFRGDGLRRAVRIAMVLGGALCLTGTLGPALGDLRLQLIATLGYGFVFPAACLLLGLLFRRPDPATGAEAGVIPSALE
jgi:hypothetical protein